MLKLEGARQELRVESLERQVVAALYDGVVDETRLEQAIIVLARRFHCHSASIVSLDPLLPQAAAALGVGSFDAVARRTYDAEFAAHDPAPAVMAARPSGTAFASDRLFSAEFRSKAVLLHEFLRPLGIEETLGGTLSSPDGRFAFLTVHRGADRAAFDDAEIAAIEGILPHVACALRLRRSFTELGSKASLLAAVIDRLAAGIVVMSGDGAVMHVNRAALEIAARGDGLWLDRTGLPHAADQAAERALSACRHAVAAGRAGGVVRVPRRSGGPPYAVFSAPLPVGTGFNAATHSARSGMLILVHDPDARAFAPETIVTVFGLPPATARLVSALAQGDDAVAYGKRHGLSYDTVRYHLKTAFARTGARSQARLLQLITRALDDIDPRR